MDDLKEKLKQAFAIGKNRNFKGSGNRLGTAEESTVRPDTRFNARHGDLAAVRNAAGASSSAAPPSPSRPSSSTPAGAPTRPTPPTLAEGPAAAALARAAAPPHGSRPRPRAPPPATSTPNPSHAPAPLPPTGPTDEEIERISIALTLLLSCDNSDLACSTLHRILSNIVNNPGEPKYRTLRLSNPKIQEAVVASPGGLDLLAAVGFHVHLQDGNPFEGIAALQPGSDLLPLRVALKYLGDNTPSSTPSQPSSSATASTSAAPEPQATPSQAPLADPQPSTSYAPPSSAPAAPTPTPLPTPPSPSPAPPADSLPAAPVTSAPATTPAPSAAAAAESAPSAAPNAALTAAPTTAPTATPTATAEATSSSAAAAQALAAAAGPSAPASTRETKVVMPVHPDTEVPDWFFERTAAEVKTEYLKMTKRNEADRQLQTRAQRELAQLRAGGKRPRGPQPASVRVRTPEGVCIQATFQPQEPLTAVFEWVTGALRRPDLQYDLVGPTRRPLGVVGRVGEADLAPSALLNLHVVGGGGVAGEPVLADGVLAQAQLAYDGAEGE